MAYDSPVESVNRIAYKLQQFRCGFILKNLFSVFKIKTLKLFSVLRMKRFGAPYVNGPGASAKK